MHLQCGRPGFNPWVEKIPWRRAWQPTPLFLPGESLWREEPGRWQGSQRVGHDWATVPTAQPLGVKTQMWIGVLTKALSIQSQSEFLLLCRQPQDIFVVEGHRDLKTIPSNHHKWNGVVFQKPAKAHQFQVFLFYCVLCLFSAHRKLTLRGSTDKRDFGKWLIWDLLELLEIGRTSAFGRKEKGVSVCVCVCVCVCVWEREREREREKERWGEREREIDFSSPVLFCPWSM